jgi:hypothetical protein
MRPRLAYAAALAFGLGVLPSPASADDRQAGFSARTVQAHDPDCVCRAQGRTFAVGESACLRTTSGARLAHCGMVLNNTSWHFTERPCPES